jgi:predicted alpha/beta hydrolase family esterase
MTNRAFIIHGYLSNPEEAWLPWLKDKLEKRGYLVSSPAMPRPNEPIISEWINFIAELVGEPDEMTFLIGHSLGCQAILRYLETVGAVGKSVARTVLVAGTFPVGRSKAEAATETGGVSVLVPWFSLGIDPGKTKRAAGQCTVILSDSDPYIAVEREEATFRTMLNPRIVIVDGQGHFNEDDRVTELPAALEAVIA